MSGGGGGSSSDGGIVVGGTGVFGSGSTSAHATKGLLFIPDQSILVSHIRANIDAASNGEDHYAQIAEVSGITAVDTVTAVLGTSATVASSSLELKGYRFPFATAVLLEAGKTYLLAAVNASGTSTTVNRVGFVSRGGSSGWDLNAPDLAAEQLIAQSLVPAKTSDVVPNSFRSVAVIAEPRLDPASGAVPWYLVASPAAIDTIEYAYLEGQDGVFIESRTGFDVDGVEIKARLDFGAKAIDWRGLYKNPGVALS